MKLKYFFNLHMYLISKIIIKNILIQGPVSMFIDLGPSFDFTFIKLIKSTIQEHPFDFLYSLFSSP